MIARSATAGQTGDDAVMDDIVSWLNAQLDAEERAARDAVPPYLKGRWRFDGTLSAVGPVVVTGDAADDRWERSGNLAVWTCDDPEDGCSEIAALWDAEGEHIARWDPARVLAEVEAKRAILASHGPVNESDCGTCVVAHWGYPTKGGSHPESWPCPTLRALALPYRDRPGYRPEWAPEQ